MRLPLFYLSKHYYQMEHVINREKSLKLKSFGLSNNLIRRIHRFSEKLEDKAVINSLIKWFEESKNVNVNDYLKSLKKEAKKKAIRDNTIRLQKQIADENKRFYDKHFQYYQEVLEKNLIDSNGFITEGFYKNCLIKEVEKVFRFRNVENWTYLEKSKLAPQDRDPYWNSNYSNSPTRYPHPCTILFWTANREDAESLFLRFNGGGCFSKYFPYNYNSNTEPLYKYAYKATVDKLSESFKKSWEDWVVYKSKNQT